MGMATRPESFRLTPWRKNKIQSKVSSDTLFEIIAERARVRLRESGVMEIEIQAQQEIRKRLDDDEAA